MAFEDPFKSPGEWLKGNLHTHTTESDGLKSPLEVADWYAARGYDFLAITDHRVRTDPGRADGVAPLCIPAMEMDGADPSINGSYHLIALGLRHMRDSVSGISLQVAIDEVKSEGGLAILAHPYWLGLNPPDVRGIHNLDGVEVFNSTCDVEIGKGDASYFWDGVLDQGMALFGVAVDDAHWKHDDAGNCWVMAKCATRSPDAILDALAKGRFYASTGPEILEFEVSDGRAYARCSPVREIRFMCQRSYGHRVRSDGAPIHEAEYELRGGERYVRLQCIDEQGRAAWANPVFV